MMRISVSHDRMIDPINALYFMNLQNALALFENRTAENSLRRKKKFQ